jgi:hypothetical protein
MGVSRATVGRRKSGNRPDNQQLRGLMLKLSDTTTGDLMPVGMFICLCDAGLIHDRHGFGHPVTGGKVDTAVRVLPSERRHLRADITHVLWFDTFLPATVR